MDLDIICKEMCSVAREVGAFQLAEINKVGHNEIETKDFNSLVSYVDKQSEVMIVDACKRLIPECGFITEEDSVENREAYYTWIIDPLDGTTNYLQRIPHYCVSIALRKGDELVIGIVYDPSMDECFYATKGGGAFLNGEKISVSKKTELSQTIIVTGFPYTNDYDIHAYFEVLQHWLMNTRGIRRFGSAALDLVYVASGRIDAYYEASLNIWDLAGGGLIVLEAGGKVTDLKGTPDFLGQGSIIACYEGIFNQVLDPITKALNK